MEDTEQTTEIQQPPAKLSPRGDATFGKGKKPRTQAQQEATRKALLALEAKRKQNWEEKKEKLIKEKEEKEKAPKESVKSEPVSAPAPIPPKPRVSFPKGCLARDPKGCLARGGTYETYAKPVPVDNIPEWAKALSDKIDMVASTIKPRKTKKVIIEEESSSSEEEVVIRRKKDKSTSTAPIPAVVADPSQASVKATTPDPFRNLITRRW